MKNSNTFILESTRSGDQFSRIPHGMNKQRAIEIAKKQLTEPKKYDILTSGFVNGVADGLNGYIEARIK